MRHLEADLATKQRALATLQEEPATRNQRFRPTDKVLAFLDSL